MSFNLLSQSIHENAEVFSFVYVLGSPDFPQQFAMRHSPIAMSGEIKKEVKFF